MLTSRLVGVNEHACAAIVEEAAREQSIPGMAWAVLDRDGILAKGAIGAADIAHGVRASTDTLFRIASMTKSFTALGLLLLRDEGVLSLTDPLVRWVPEARALVSPTKDAPVLTLGMLASMGGGLVEDDPWADRQLAMEAEDFVQLLEGGIGFDRDPGVAFEYSNLGYALLGLAIERASGRSLPEFVSERILGPLGMTTATFAVDRAEVSRRAAGYSLVDGRPVEEPLLAHGAFGAMGGLAVSVEELARWVGLHLRAWPPRDDPEGGLVARATLREMATASRMVVPAKDKDPEVMAQGYGYGLMIVHHRSLGRLVGHSGGLPGFGSRMEWDPVRGVGAVVVANRTYARLVQVARALLAEAASSIEPPVTVSAPLEAAIQAIGRALEDPSAIEGAVAPTYWLDRDDNRRPPDFAALVARLGRPAAVGAIAPEGRLRGKLSIQGEAASAVLEVLLEPSAPHRIQFVDVSVED